MRGSSGILSPRRALEPPDDLAERYSFVAGQRVHRRRARVRASALRRSLSLAAALAVLVAGSVVLVHWLLTAPRFAVAEVEVRGLRWLEEAEVRAAAGIAGSENLFRLDTRAVAERIERLPRVKRAEVIRGFPNRVTLLVEERLPFALLVSAGRLHWADEEGRVLGPEPRAVVPGLPVITGLDTDRAPVGVQGSAERTRTALALLRTMLRTGTPLAGRVSEIDVRETGGGPVLYTVDGVEVRLGDEAWEERLGRLEGVLAQLQAQGEPVEAIDLRFRDQVVLKPRK
ncbi:MAG: FtsQ-type POTRA domain-containing protein [Candidatus Rokubacteria bacterium]|nr:FtsQ-type POTRA domain-containing protein [Candidatus Rokubacteria bacterium]